MVFSQILGRVITLSLLPLLSLADFKEALTAETPRVFRNNVREELDQLEYFQGTWSCKGKQNQSPSSGEFKFIWKMERKLNDLWFIAQEDPPAKNYAWTEAKTQELWGYDTASKQFIRIIATIEGNFFNFTSSGWQTDKPKEIVWDGSQTDGFGGKRRWRKVVIKKSETEFEVTNHILIDVEGPASWQPDSVELCKKQNASRSVN